MDGSGTNWPWKYSHASHVHEKDQKSEPSGVLLLGTVCMYILLNTIISARESYVIM
jgi:hypothetical protein